MPAVSKKQQKFFGIVRAIQKGEQAPTTPETAKAAADMKKGDVKKFASTKHKGLPNKVVQKEESNPRIPRKKGQPAGSKKHSDLYTDENPKGTIHGLGFKDVATAKASVSKIRSSSRSHAHKIQAAVAMEQRAREMGKTSEAAVYRKFINTMKKKTKAMNEEGLRAWFGKSSGTTKSGRKVKGWVQVGGKYDGKPCARQPGQKTTPKCTSSSKRASMSDKERDSAARRKRAADPGQPQKSGAAAPTNVSTDPKKKMKENISFAEAKDKKGKGSGTKDACYHKVKSRYSVWPSAYASGALVKCRKVGAANWGNSRKEEVEYEVNEMKSNPDFVGVGANKKYKEKDSGTTSYNKINVNYKPGIGKTGDATVMKGGAYSSKFGKDNPIGTSEDDRIAMGKEQKKKIAAMKPKVVKDHYNWRDTLDEKCWAGYEKKGMKTMFGKRYPNCVKKSKKKK